MRKKLSTILLAVVMAVGLLLSAPLPTFAASGGTPEITWLSAEGEPRYYNEEFGWLTLYGRGYSTIDLTTGAQGEYYIVTGFFDGMAWARNDSGVGYIDTTGAVVVPFGEYNYIEDFSDGLARVGKAVRNGEQYGYIDTTGKLVIPLEYSEARDFSDGLACVSKDGKYGYIDKTGAVVISLEYDGAGSFSEGLAWVYKYGWGYGYIDKTGAVVISLKDGMAGSFSEGLAWVYEDGAKIIDRTGAVVGQFPSGYDFVVDGDANGIISYDNFHGFHDGLMLVRKYAEDGNQKYGFIDKTGAVVISPEYDGAGGFSDGLAVVYKDGEGFGFIDTTGAVVVPLEYGNAGFVTGGENDTVSLCYVQKGLSYGIFENPCYVRTEVPSDSEPGNTEEPGGESPESSSSVSQNPQSPTDSGNGSSPSGEDNSNGGGFPVVPVVSAAGGATVAAVIVVLVLKKKK